jgi:hypothetical protein
MFDPVAPVALVGAGVLLLPPEPKLLPSLEQAKGEAASNATESETRAVRALRPVGAVSMFESLEEEGHGLPSETARFFSWNFYSTPCF